MHHSALNNSHRREKHDLILDILHTALEGETKTRIVNRVGMSGYQAKRLFGGLARLGYIAEESGKWKTTKKGGFVIGACDLCREIVNQIYS